jgi:phosphoribosylanthranilate isomerase
MIIKVCGMRDAENIREVKTLDIDWMGFIFWQDSPRYVQQISSRAGIIADYSSLQELETLPKRVGVFVDDMPQNIVTRVVNYELDIVQLHGSESPVMIDNLRRTLDPDIHPGIQIMKALSIASEEDLKRYQDYVGHVDYFLFDTKTPLVGGSGKQFDWSILEDYDGDVPFLLSGGIGPDDVARVKAFHHPKMLGIDLNSRFETAPAVKDVEQLRSFVNELRG